MRADLEKVGPAVGAELGQCAAEAFDRLGGT
jgi:hypothetical protein